MIQISKLEQKVLNMLLAEEGEEFSILREQLIEASVSKREMTGVGFYTTYVIPEEARKLRGNQSIKFGDVEAEIFGLKNGAGFILYIENGYIHMLEGYSYEEPWPEEIVNFQLRYMPTRKKDVEDFKSKLRNPHL